jgi:glutathione S-transferase
MKLHILPPSPRAMKVVALKNYLQLDCEIRVLDYFRAEQTSPKFAVVNPNRRMPVLEDDGFVLWESNAILHYLASKRPEAGLWPSHARGHADALRWLFWEGAHWDQAWDILITERLKKTVFNTHESGRRTQGRASSPSTPDPARIAEGERYIQELATILNAHLSGRTWLVGETLSIADFAIGAWLPASGPVGFSIANYGEIVRWYRTIEALPDGRRL